MSMSFEDEMNFAVLGKIKQEYENLKKQELQAIKELLASGWNLPSIGKPMGLSHQGLRRRLNEGHYYGEVVLTPRPHKHNYNVNIPIVETPKEDDDSFDFWAPS